MAETDSWRCSHFSLANPRGATETDLPRLLRRLARRIAALGPGAEVLDVVVHSTEVTERGTWWSATVYYSPAEEPD